MCYFGVIDTPGHTIEIYGVRNTLEDTCLIIHCHSDITTAQPSSTLPITAHETTASTFVTTFPFVARE